MIKNTVFVLIIMLLLSCSAKSPTEFSKKALEDIFISVDKQEVTFKDILAKNKGKKILIDVWASWCPDCLKSLPNVKKIQEENPEVVFLYLSLDKDLILWQEGVERLKIKGQHYFMQSGREGNFGEFLNLSWIPRYLVIDEQGKIVIFNETTVNDELIAKIAKK